MGKTVLGYNKYFNWIGNGNFFGGRHVDNFNASDGTNLANEIVTFNNPGASDYVLRQGPTGGANNEYEIHPRIGLSRWNGQNGIGLQPSTTYNTRCWVAYSSDYNGSRRVLHSRYYKSDGTNVSVNGSPNTGNFTVLETKQVGGTMWEYVQETFTTSPLADGRFNLYLGYPTQNTAGYRYITGVELLEENPEESILWQNPSVFSGFEPEYGIFFSSDEGSSYFDMNTPKVVGFWEWNTFGDMPANGTVLLPDTIEIPEGKMWVGLAQISVQHCIRNYIDLSSGGDHDGWTNLNDFRCPEFRGSDNGSYIMYPPLLRSQLNNYVLGAESPFSSTSTPNNKGHAPHISVMLNGESTTQSEFLGAKAATVGASLVHFVDTSNNIVEWPMSSIPVGGVCLKKNQGNFSRPVWENYQFPIYMLILEVPIAVSFPEQSKTRIGHLGTAFGDAAEDTGVAIKDEVSLNKNNITIGTPSILSVGSHSAEDTTQGTLSTASVISGNWTVPAGKKWVLYSNAQSFSGKTSITNTGADNSKDNLDDFVDGYLATLWEGLPTTGAGGYDISNIFFAFFANPMEAGTGFFNVFMPGMDGFATYCGTVEIAETDSISTISYRVRNLIDNQFNAIWVNVGRAQANSSQWTNPNEVTTSAMPYVIGSAEQKHNGIYVGTDIQQARLEYSHCTGASCGVKSNWNSGTGRAIDDDIWDVSQNGVAGRLPPSYNIVEPKVSTYRPFSALNFWPDNQNTSNYFDYSSTPSEYWDWRTNYRVNANGAPSTVPSWLFPFPGYAWVASGIENNPDAFTLEHFTGTTFDIDKYLHEPTPTYYEYTLSGWGGGNDWAFFWANALISSSDSLIKGILTDSISNTFNLGQSISSGTSGTDLNLTYLTTNAPLLNFNWNPSSFSLDDFTELQDAGWDAHTSCSFSWMLLEIPNNVETESDIDFLRAKATMDGTKGVELQGYTSSDIIHPSVDDLTTWTSWFDTANGASGTLTKTNSLLSIEITNSGTGSSSVQLYYGSSTFSIAEGEQYRLRFKASNISNAAEVARDIYIKLIGNSSPWASYAEENVIPFKLKYESTGIFYEKVFTANATVSDVRLDFMLGTGDSAYTGVTSTLTFSNIELLPIAAALSTSLSSTTPILKYSNVFEYVQDAPCINTDGICSLQTGDPYVDVLYHTETLCEAAGGNWTGLTLGNANYTCEDLIDGGANTCEGFDSIPSSSGFSASSMCCFCQGGSYYGTANGGSAGIVDAYHDITTSNFTIPEGKKWIVNIQPYKNIITSDDSNYENIFLDGWSATGTRTSSAATSYNNMSYPYASWHPLDPFYEGPPSIDEVYNMSQFTKNGILAKPTDASDDDTFYLTNSLEAGEYDWLKVKCSKSYVGFKSANVPFIGADILGMDDETGDIPDNGTWTPTTDIGEVLPGATTHLEYDCKFLVLIFEVNDL